MIKSLSLGAKSAAEIVREVIREAEDNNNKGGAGKLVVNFFPFILGLLVVRPIGNNLLFSLLKL